MRAAYPLYGALYALLTTNTLWYLFAGPWTRALDSLAWFVLLMLFTVETLRPRWLENPRLRRCVHVLRYAVITAIIAAAAGYAKQNEWLDLFNVALWLMVVALIECELRLPRGVARNRRWFTRVAVTLYSAIALLIPLWALRGEWLDAYDAALWLIAFALIEMAALKPARRDSRAIG